MATDDDRPPITDRDISPPNPRWRFQREAHRRSSRLARRVVSAGKVPIVPRRIALHVAEATARELLNCVQSRLKERGGEADHITKIAERMLLEALETP